MEIKEFFVFCIFYFFWKKITLRAQNVYIYFNINTSKQINKSREAQ